eukprot:TRINITY_DN10509_c0_g2_i1.p1 TRINITY_DN10509_c0_g2~~TRINITY_DN10509_c0_g2_i1.p1  ORF type:complete len:148 (-),score=10.39 TRINITY_DN10509_c0_g2_i1:35-478(-)
MNLLSPVGTWLVANLDKQILTVILAITLVTTVTMLNVFPFIIAIVKTTAAKKLTNDEEVSLLSNEDMDQQQLLAQDKELRLLQFGQIGNYNIPSDSTQQNILKDEEMAYDSENMYMKNLQTPSSSAPTSQSDNENCFIDNQANNGQV